MTILMWISRWQNEMELMIMGLQIILFLFLTIGVFCIVRQQKKANRCRRRLELYLKKHMDKPKKKEEKRSYRTHRCVSHLSSSNLGRQNVCL